MATPLQDRRADRSSWDRVRVALESAGCRPRARGDHLDARCPAHEDRRPSLSVDWRESPDRGGFTVVYCHTGCSGEAVTSALGLSWDDLFDSEISPGHQMQKSASVVRRPAPKPAAPRELPPRRDWPRNLGKPEAVYRYESATGELLYEIGRWVTPEGKTFRGRHPVPGRPGWWRLALPADRVLYRLPELAAAIERGDLVYLVEGERDADALAAIGATATTKPNGAIKAPEEWRPEWTAALAGARLVIVADRDEAGYRHAAAVLEALGNAPASVSVVRTPIEEPKADVSDHLAAGLKLAELEPVPADQLEPGALGRVLSGPWPTRKEDRRGGGGGEPPASATWRIVRDEYAADDRALYKLGSAGKEPAEKRREARELLNVRVRLARRVRRDMGDGSRPVVSHVDLEAARGSETVELGSVEWKDFEALTWTAELPWADVSYRRTPAGRSDVVNAIARTSGEHVPMVTAFGTLGWRRRDAGDWMYVHAAGAIDAAGPVEATRVDIPTDLHCYALPDPPSDPAVIADAVKSSTALLSRVPARIAAPLLGAAYRAVLGESSTTVFLLGATGTGKSGLAAQLLQHSAPTVRHDRLPIPAGEDGATVTAIEELRYIAGHVPFVADDLAPDKGSDRSATRANILARSQHNRVGKLRGKRDGGTRPHHHPRGLLVLTGEDGASAPSAENRIVYVPIARGEVSPVTLAELETDAMCTARAQLTAAVVRWAAGRMPMDEWIRRTRAEFAELLRSPAADPGPDARRADAMADLAVGWHAMLEAAVNLGALSEDEAGDIWAHAWCGLVDAKNRQASVTAGRTLTERTADVLRSALVSGRVHIAGSDGGQPDVTGDRLRSWGWSPGPGLLGQAEPRPNGDCVGWLAPGGLLWLEAGVLVSAIEAQSRAEGEPLRTNSRALGAALADAGLATTEAASDGVRNAVRRRAAGERHRVFEVPATWLFPLEPDELPAPPPAPVIPPPTVPDPVPPAAPARPEMQISASTDQVKPPATDPDPEPEPERPAVSSSTEYIGAALVVDADRAHLAVPGAAARELPAPPSTLAELLTWAEAAPLGVHHDYARDDYGQVWLTAAAARRYGLPTRRPSESAAGKLAAARDLEAAGWQLGKGGFGWWWVKVFRPGGRTVYLVMPSWATEGDCPLLAGDPAADELARRIATYTEHVGTAWHISSGVTGIRALELSRTRAPIKVTEAVTPPPVCKRGRSDVLEVDLLWQRAPETDELAMPWVHAYDLNGMYLAAASSVRVGLGAAEHRESPEFDPTLPGYWRVTPPEWRHARLPDPFDPTGRDRRGARWLTTPSLRALHELGWWDGEVAEAYVWPTIGTGGKLPGARYLEHWYARLRDARAALIRTAHDRPGDAAVLTAVKWTYAHGVGRLDADKAAGQPLYRPDWRHHLIGTARSNLLRKLAAAAEAGRYPLAIATDCVLYASDDPDPVTACPPGLSIGAGLGAAKPAGTAAMAEALPLLTAGKRPDKTALLDLFAEGATSNG